MSLNAAEVALVGCALDASLGGSGLRGVRHLGVDDRAIALTLRKNRQNIYLRVDATPGETRAHTIEGVSPAERVPSAFVMLLRKHLVGAQCDRVWSVPNDRVLIMSWVTRDDHTFELVAELTGRAPNILLIDQDGVILGSIRTHRANGTIVRPGMTYEPLPPPTPKSPIQSRDGFPADLDDVDAFVRAHYEVPTDEVGLDRERDAIQRSIRRAQKRLEKRVRALERDRDRVHEATTLQRYGELLQSAYGNVERGASSATVPDFYLPEAPQVEIPLDASRSLQENIASYFSRARKFTRGATEAQIRIDDARRELGALAEMDRQVAAATTTDGVRAIVERAKEIRALRGGLDRQARGGGRDPSREKSEAARRPYKMYSASDGATILVGRGGSDNDRLTFGVARAHDLWLHCDDAPGAHVIIRATRDSAPSRATIEEAALLAAFFSRKTTDAVVCVRYTERRNLRKPKGMAPGRVTLSGGKTVDVRTDDPRLTALLDRRVLP